MVCPEAAADCECGLESRVVAPGEESCRSSPNQFAGKQGWEMRAAFLLADCTAEALVAAVGQGAAKAQFARVRDEVSAVLDQSLVLSPAPAPVRARVQLAALVEAAHNRDGKWAEVPYWIEHWEQSAVAYFARDRRRRVLA